jgi:hypothetical protein
MATAIQSGGMAAALLAGFCAREMRGHPLPFHPPFTERFPLLNV